MSEEMDPPFPVVGWPIASNAIQLRSSTAWSLDQLGHPEDWQLLRLPDDVHGEFVPRVARVTAIEGGAVVHLDGNMRPGVVYRLVALRPGGGAPGEVDVVGPTRTVDAVIDRADRPLTDLAMPSAEGPLVGDVAASDGDFATTDARTALETAVWALLLTPRGRLDWDPTFGTDLGLKRARAADLAREQRRLAEIVNQVPGVASSQVMLTFDRDHMTVAVAVQARAETFTFRREIPHAAQ